MSLGSSIREERIQNIYKFCTPDLVSNENVYAPHLTLSPCRTHNISAANFRGTKIRNCNEFRQLESRRDSVRWYLTFILLSSLPQRNGFFQSSINRLSVLYCNWGCLYIGIRLRMGRIIELPPRNSLAQNTKPGVKVLSVDYYVFLQIEFWICMNQTIQGKKNIPYFITYWLKDQALFHLK